MALLECCGLAHGVTLAYSIKTTTARISRTTTETRMTDHQFPLPNHAPNLRLLFWLVKYIIANIKLESVSHSPGGCWYPISR
jgi:hypothetical protein